MLKCTQKLSTSFTERLLKKSTLAISVAKRTIFIFTILCTIPRSGTIQTSTKLFAAIATAYNIQGIDFIQSC